MIKLKRIMSAVLAAATIVSLTACATDSNGATGNNSNSSTATTIDDEIENPVSIGDISIDAGDEVEPAELQYLGCYDITTAGDVKPAYKYFQENYGCTINCTIVSSLQIQEKLATAISSGESPDLVDYAENTFPLLMSKNMYTPLDSYMDLSAPQWSGLEQYINKYRWNNNNYYYPWSYDISPYFLIYNRGLFSDLSIPDPKELYDEGNWTWDTFKDCMQKFVDSDDERTGLYGYAATSFIDATGTPLISIGNDGLLQCNLVNANVERAANYMQDLKKEGLAEFATDYIDVSEEPITAGLSGFQAMGGWIITNYSKKMAKDESLDIFFVPFPRDPNADKYYYSMSTFGYLVPAGSKYAEQASVFINCCRLSVTDADLKETTKESIMKNKKYTDEQYEFLMEFKEVQNFDAVVDEPFGLDENSATLIKGMLNNALFETDDENFAGKTWTQMRESSSGSIMSQIEYYNGLIKNGNE